VERLATEYDPQISGSQLPEYLLAVELVVE
jgi:hypothetical protein